MSFYKAIVTVGGLTLGSRILGFVRDILTAAILGAGPIADAFFVALKLPNFFRRITAEGAFSASFVPLFAGDLEEKGKESAIEFAEYAQSIMLTCLIPFTILMLVAMPWVLYVVAPGFADTPARLDMAVEMARLTFPYILMMSLTALLGGVMNSFNRFGPFAAAPMLFNIVLILALLFLTPFVENGGYAMAWGLIVAGFLQFGYLFYALRKMGIILKLKRPKMTPRVKKLFQKMGPGVLGAGMVQINLFIDLILASLLPVGSISYLYYADRLYQLPLGVIGIAIGTALLPMLSRSVRIKDTARVQQLFSRSIEVCVMLSVPAAVAYIMIGESIIDVLFVRGAFDVHAGVASAMALKAYAIGLPAFIISKALMTVFFAHEDTATPVKYAIICTVANTLLAIVLIFPLQHVGIALAMGITAWLNIFLLARGLMKRKILTLERQSQKIILMVLLSSVLMGLILWVINKMMMPSFLGQGEFMKILGLMITLACGGGFYGVFLFITGVLKLDYIKQLFPKAKKQDKIDDSVEIIRDEEELF